MHATDLKHLHGQLALVCSARDHRNPPTARRGTIWVREFADRETPMVQVELEFPQMFTTRAHNRVITLSDEQIAQMLASEPEGAYIVTLDDRLDSEVPPDRD